MNKEQAFKKRDELAKQCSELQTQLGALRLDPDAPFPAQRSVREERARVNGKLLRAVDELRKVKAECRQFNLGPSRKKEEICEEWDGTVDLARHAFSDLWRYVSYLEHRVKELEKTVEENTKIEF